MVSLLVLHHSPTASVRALTEAALRGAQHPDVEGVEVRVIEALAFARGEADHRTILDADGYLLITPANFGSMSGALKHVFDSTFLQIGGALGTSGEAAGAGGSTRGRPFGLIVHGRYDTTGAARAVESITGALGWRTVARSLDLLGPVHEDDVEQATELAATLAATLQP